MPFYRDHIYPHLVSLLANPEPIRRVRQRIVPLAQGQVLEIGVGPGVNFVHHDPARVSKVYALEPNPGMLRLAEQQRRRTELDVEFLDLPGERIPFRAGGDGIPRQIPQVVGALLVGHRGPAITVAVVRHSALTAFGAGMRVESC